MWGLWRGPRRKGPREKSPIPAWGLPRGQAHLLVWTGPHLAVHPGAIGESQAQLLGEVRQDLAEGHPRALQRLQRHGVGGQGQGPRRGGRGRGQRVGVRSWGRQLTGEVEVGDRPRQQSAAARGEEWRDRRGLGTTGQPQPRSEQRRAEVHAVGGLAGRAANPDHASRRHTRFKGAREDAPPRVGTRGLRGDPWWSEERAAGHPPRRVTRCGRVSAAWTAFAL